MELPTWLYYLGADGVVQIINYLILQSYHFSISCRSLNEDVWAHCVTSTLSVATNCGFISFSGTLPTLEKVLLVIFLRNPELYSRFAFCDAVFSKGLDNLGCNFLLFGCVVVDAVSILCAFVVPDLV